MLGGFAMAISALIVAYSGIKYMTSNGISEAQTKAIRSMNAALMGFALIFLVYAGLNFFLDFVEYNAFTEQGIFTSQTPPQP